MKSPKRKARSKPKAGDAFSEEINRLAIALCRIAKLDPEVDSDEGWNEWGEAHCFRQAQEIAKAALDGKSFAETT